MNMNVPRSSRALTLSSPRSRQRLSSTQETRHKAVVMQRNQSLIAMDPSKDPTFRVQVDGLYLQQTVTTNNTVTVDWIYCPAKSWMQIDHFLLEHSSVINPNFIYERMASNERRFTLPDCTPGTKYFFVISAIDAYGKVIIRSQNITVQTSAPIDRPVLELRKALPNCITIEWSEPAVYGDGHISEYHLYVDGKYFTTIPKNQRRFDFVQCSSLQHFTFRVQAISLRHECNSESSNVLDVTCPAVLPITLTRMRPKKINIVQVTWNQPTCVGFAKVKEFKVYYKEVSKHETYNDQEVPDDDKIIGHRHSIMRSYKPDQTISTVVVEPYKRYWAILTADVLPEGCPAVKSAPIRVRATIKPIAPEIKVTVYGQRERYDINRKITILLTKRDEINRRKDIFRSSEIVTGAELKNEEVKNMDVMFYEMEQELLELVTLVNKFTGFVPVVIDWERPKFDEFSEPTSYQINVDDHSYQEPLSLETTQHSLKLDVEKDSHSISLTTLSWHPVGHSEQSNMEVLQTKEFRPNRFFCYFTSHKKNVSWPGKGACRLEDCLAHEKKLTSKNNVHRGLVQTRSTPQAFRVMGVHDATWQWLIRHFGAKKPSIILFWTKWCISSQNTLEKFAHFALQMKDKYLYLACCVKSEEDFHTHRKSVIELLNRKKMRTVGNIRHCCACHVAPEISSNTVQKMQNASIPASFDLAGVPTFVILDVKGQIAWQGRVSAETNEAFINYMRHAMSQVEEKQCPNIECEQCKNEEEVTYEKTDHVNNDESKQDHEELKFTLDEFHVLHSKVHGKSLEDVEKTQDESYDKVDSVSPRKNWRERRLANRKKADEEKQVRFIDVKGEQPPQVGQSEESTECTEKTMNGTAQIYQMTGGRGYEPPRNQHEEIFEISKQQQLRKVPETSGEYGGKNVSYPEIGDNNTGAYTSNHHNHHDNEKPKVRFMDQAKPIADFRHYQYRNPSRDYRSPNNGYEKGRYGYGGVQMNPKEVPDDVIETNNEENSEKDKSRYRYSSINYHKSSVISTGDDQGMEQKEKKTTQSNSTNLGYSWSAPKKSAIRVYNVHRDMSRGNALSSTWPRSGFVQNNEEEYEFMKPLHLRGKENSSPDIRKESTTSYIYKRPSTTICLESNIEKNKGKYPNIRSRYARGIYQPKSAKRRPHTSSARRSASTTNVVTINGTMERNTPSRSSSRRSNRSTNKGQRF